MKITRRRLLTTAAALAPAIGSLPRLARALEPGATEKADYTLRIATGLGRARARSTSSRRRSTTASFRGRCCASRKVSASSSTSTTTPIRRNSCIGTGR